MLDEIVLNELLWPLSGIGERLEDILEEVLCL